MGDFEDFAIGGHGDGFGGGGGQARIAEAGHDLVAFGEQGVPGEDGRGDAEARMRGRMAAAQIGVVHDVVMEQGGHMEHFHRRREPIDVVFFVPEQP